MPCERHDWGARGSRVLMSRRTLCLSNFIQGSRARWTGPPTRSQSPFSQAVGYPTISLDPQPTSPGSLALPSYPTASPYSKISPDIGSTLADRALRLRALITFIRQNGLLETLDQPCLRGLSTHSEIVAAAQSLWNYQNDDRRMRWVCTSAVTCLQSIDGNVKSQSNGPAVASVDIGRLDTWLFD